MKKAEYLEKLREKLETFGRELQEEILEDYREHFAEGEKQGKSEEEIIDELGNIEDMIQEMIQDLPEPEGEAVSWVQEPEKSYTYSETFKEVVLKGGVAKIMVSQSEDDQLHVNYEDNGSLSNQMKYEFCQRQENGVYYAEVKRRENVEDSKDEGDELIKIKLFGRTIISYGNASNFGKENHSIILTVKLPQGMPKLNTTVSSGDICLSGLELEEYKATSASGDVNIKEVKIAHSEVHTASGDICVENGTFDKGKFTTASGNINVNDTCISSGSLTTASGNISMKEGGAGEVKYATASGNINLSTNAEGYECGTASGNIKVKAVGTPKKAVLNTASGNVQFHLEDASGVEATVRTMSGNAKVGWKDETRITAKKGTFRYGDGSCKVSIKSVSGNINVQCV
ncbi:MAG: DUF4097 family beta strand repeat protein [Lachnospiraceae bacterium]|nr:DUF4097 family beta strand repeat protein [Lachnospiraceae bacterium]